MTTYFKQILTDCRKKWTLFIFFNSTQNILSDVWHTSATLGTRWRHWLLPRAAKTSMRFWSNTMPRCFGTGFSNHQGTLGITLHHLPKY